MLTLTKVWSAKISRVSLDVKGKNFRDDIVSGAVANGKGEVEYAYQKPGATGIFDKVAMYIKVKGSDGKDYILVSGKYKDKEKK